MVAWWWVLVALIIGEVIGIVVPTFCAMNDRHESKYIKK